MLARALWRCLALPLFVCATAAGATEPRAPPASLCGGFVRTIAGVDVEVSARGPRLEVRLANADSAVTGVQAMAALITGGHAVQIALTEHQPGLLVGSISEAANAGWVVLRLSRAGDAIGSARFPLRPSTCLLNPE